jgi:hypothetical protein
MIWPSTANGNRILHELDEVEVKHGIPVAVVNLYADQFGNPEVPNKIKYAAAERAAAQKRGGAKQMAADSGVD